MMVNGIEFQPVCRGVSNLFTYLNQLLGDQRVRAQNASYTGHIMAEKKEAPTMQVEYNGFTGELVKLERSYTGKFELPVGLTEAAHVKWLYDLSIYDSKQQVTHSFTGVKLYDIKFLGGAVSFGG